MPAKKKRRKRKKNPAQLAPVAPPTVSGAYVRVPVRPELAQAAAAFVEDATKAIEAGRTLVGLLDGLIGK